MLVIILFKNDDYTAYFWKGSSFLLLQSALLLLDMLSFPKLAAPIVAVLTVLATGIVEITSYTCTSSYKHNISGYIF
jgi:hypothetical protein